MHYYRLLMENRGALASPVWSFETKLLYNLQGSSVLNPIIGYQYRNEKVIFQGVTSKTCAFSKYKRYPFSDIFSGYFPPGLA